MSDYQEIEINIGSLQETQGKFPARTAVASFLFMVMPIDGQTHPKELERLGRILSDDFNLDEKQTAELIEHAKNQDSSTETLIGLAETLKKHLSKKELLLLISHMWEMVFADGRLHETEIVYVERVALLLDIPKDQVSKAMTE